jgi:ADP-ribosylglycohydrolase
MNKTRIENAIKGALTADRYALGAHWVYEPKELAKLPIDWEDLNDPQSMWHQGKKRGDQTHYGDHMLWLLEFVQTEGTFDAAKYRDFWMDKMQTYTGYIDASTRESMENFMQNPNSVEGSASHDLSIIGRIAPLLLVSSNEEEFLNHVFDFVKITHNSALVMAVAIYFATMLFRVVKGGTVIAALQTTAIHPDLEKTRDTALFSTGKDTAKTIQKFGPACGVEGGFEGVLHLLVSYGFFKEMMIENAKAGGDSAARGMIAGMLLGAQGEEIPQEWQI